MYKIPTYYIFTHDSPEKHIGLFSTQVIPTMIQWSSSRILIWVPDRDAVGVGEGAFAR